MIERPNWNRIKKDLRQIEEDFSDGYPVSKIKIDKIMIDLVAVRLYATASEQRGFMRNTSRKTINIIDSVINNMTKELNDQKQYILKDENYTKVLDA